jgi:hypothetical protein
MNAMKRTQGIVIKWVMAGSASFVLTLGMGAQVQTSTKVEHGTSTQSVNVERAEVVSVSGNDLIVKMADGELRDFPNVPERTTVVTTTPRMITTVRTVTGKVFHVSPPNSVILTLEDGTNQSFKIPQGQKFTINGKVTDAFGLKKGMNVTATAVTETPETVVAHEVKHTGTMPPPPPEAPQQGVTLLVVVLHPAPAPVESAAAAEPAPNKLPKTATSLPLIGLFGALLCSFALGLKAKRAFSS